MRAVWIPRPGPPEVLELREGPDPTPTADQVLVRVHGSGVNFADVSARLGFYPDAPAPPCVVGYEVSGVVERAGANVSGLRPGDRVFALTRFVHAQWTAAHLEAVHVLNRGLRIRGRHFHEAEAARAAGLAVVHEFD